MKKVRYVLFFISLIVMSNNLFQCLLESASIWKYVMFVGTPLVYSLLFILIKNDKIIPLTFLIVGFLTLADMDIGRGISGGIFFICLGLSLLNKLWINIVGYFLTVIIVVGIHMVNGQTLTQAINILLIYGLIYFLEYELSIRKVLDGRKRHCDNCKGR